MTDTQSVVRDEGSTGHRRSASMAHESAQPIFSEYVINHRESFRAEISNINGREVVCLARWKSTQDGMKRTGSAFEFGAHRLDAIVGILANIQAALYKGCRR